MRFPTELGLTRTVRLPLGAIEPAGPGNGLVGVPGAAGLAPTIELRVTCRGTPGDSGYLVDIATVDRAARSEAPPLLRMALAEELAGGAPTDLTALLSVLADRLAPLLPAPIASIAVLPSSFRWAALSWDAPESGSDMSTRVATLHETFEFAASHRLHCPDRTAEENRALFGKCNNPNGHGHNYRIEVAVEPGEGFPGFAAIERCVASEVMGRFDHKHLNLDCPEFREVNPSVENIARVCHDLLAPALAAEGGRLRFVQVWETDKTSCRYPA